MIAGREYCGPLADIWSMGIILFALVCGYLPFEDPNTANLYKKILSGRVPHALICSALYFILWERGAVEQRCIRSSR
jgi:serine/threonine protein kinase